MVRYYKSKIKQQDNKFTHKSPQFDLWSTVYYLAHRITTTDAIMIKDYARRASLPQYDTHN